MDLLWSQCVFLVILLSFDFGTLVSNVTLSPEFENIDFFENPIKTFMKTCTKNRITSYKDAFRLPDTRMLVRGGYKALRSEFPHVLALGFYNSKKKHYQFDCGGSLISSTFILTAAHCIYNPDKNKLKIVRLGTNKVPEMITKKDPNLDFGVKRIIPHENYDGGKRLNDIALVELAKCVSHKPVCLYTKNKDPRNLQVAGWGYVDFYGSRSSMLQTVKVPSIPLKECKKVILKKLNKTVESSHICAGNSEANTCDGDSGGPLHVKINQMFYLVGITSFGDHCGTVAPGVYTRVSSFLDWIEKNIWP